MKPFGSMAASGCLLLSCIIPCCFFGAELFILKARAFNVEKGSSGASLESDAGNGGSLLAMLPGGKEIGCCPLKHTDVTATVSGYISRVTVKQVFHNSLHEKIDALYTFPISENAAVDQMTIKIADRTIRGSVKKREEARAIYERAKLQGHVAALLDQERPNVFSQNIANIEPGETVCVEISYVELLKYDGGTFTLSIPTVVGKRFNGAVLPGKVNRTNQADLPATVEPNSVPAFQRAGHDLSISVDIQSGFPTKDIQSKIHQIKVERPNSEHVLVSLAKGDSIPNRDFVLSWKVAADTISSSYLTHRDDKSGYFTLMMLPPARATVQQIAPKEMIFLIDCSGSQRGAPLQKAKETLSYILNHMNANDTLQIIAFNDGAMELAKRPQKVTPEMRKKAQDFIDSLEANGGTWMGPAVMDACSQPHEQNRLRIVTFMTDGYVGNDFEILGLIKQFRGDSRWFSFGTGNSVNRFLVDAIAKEGGGEAEYVLLNSSPAEAGRRFYDRISSPVLTDVKLKFNGVEVKDVYPSEPADVWAERPLYIKGRYLKPGAGTVTLSGNAAGKPYLQTLNLSFPEKQRANEVVKSTWARAKVDRLMSEDWKGVQSGSLNPELKDEITKTGVDYQLMTQYTSFVAVDESRVTKGRAGKSVNVPVEAADGVSVEEGGSGAGWYRSSPATPSASCSTPKPSRAHGGGGGGGASNGPVRFQTGAGPFRPSPALGPVIQPTFKGGGGGAGAGDSCSGSVGRVRQEASTDCDYGPYMADLQRRAKRQWFPPRGQESRRPVVTFTIGSDGSISNLRIVRSSGASVADEASLQAIRAASPFRPLPVGSPTSVDIEFTFDYNVFGAGNSGKPAATVLPAKLDAILRQSLASMKAQPGVDVNSAGELMVRLVLTDTRQTTLEKLATAKFVRLRVEGKSVVVGRIRLENLTDLCLLNEVSSVTAVLKK